MIHPRSVPPTTCSRRSARSARRHAPYQIPSADQQDRPRGTDAQQSALLAQHNPPGPGCPQPQSSRNQLLSAPARCPTTITQSGSMQWPRATVMATPQQSKACQVSGVERFDQPSSISGARLAEASSTPMARQASTASNVRGWDALTSSPVRRKTRRSGAG